MRKHSPNHFTFIGSSVLTGVVLIKVNYQQVTYFMVKFEREHGVRWRFDDALLTKEISSTSSIKDSLEVDVLLVR